MRAAVVALDFMAETSCLPIPMLLPSRKLLSRRTFLPAEQAHIGYVSEDPRLCRTYLAAMEVLAKPWNGMLIRVLEEGPLRFSELADRVPQIADRMLAARLKELEARGLVRRTVEPGPPVRVSYALTDVGRGHREVAEALMRWGRLIVTAQDEAAPPPKRGARARASR
jgi:DNA-binding HxlR family transcriptional regulator